MVFRVGKNGDKRWKNEPGSLFTGVRELPPPPGTDLSRGGHDEREFFKNLGRSSLKAGTRKSRRSGDPLHCRRPADN